jgi:hypothetical protein
MVSTELRQVAVDKIHKNKAVFSIFTCLSIENRNQERATFVLMFVSLVSVENPACHFY